ncbi:MAG: hypothetical protein II808_03745, partial [Clostridia bacterium]|nr:hypothetical protein [Clostridia bacterium]
GFVYAAATGRLDTVWPWLDFVTFAATGVFLLLRKNLFAGIGLAAVAATRLAYIVYIAVLDIEGIVSGDYGGLPWSFWGNIVADYFVYIFALLAFATAAMILILCKKAKTLGKLWFISPIFLILAVISHFCRMIFLVISYADFSAFMTTYFIALFPDFIVFIITIIALVMTGLWAKRLSAEETA